MQALSRLSYGPYTRGGIVASSNRLRQPAEYLSLVSAAPGCGAGNSL